MLTPLFFTFVTKFNVMKKSLFFILLFAAMQVHSQVIIGKLKSEEPQPGTGFNWDRIDTPLYIDYSYLNNDLNGTRWNVNEYYTSSDSSINFSGVAYDNICGYYDYANYSTTVVTSADLGFSSVYPATTLLRFDSVQVEICHENNSGFADTMIVEMRELNANNTLSTTTLWSDSLITNVGLSAGNTWSDGQTSLLFLRFSVGYNTVAGQKVGFVFRYLNHNKLDTLGLIAGFTPFSLGATSAIQSSYKNSFLRFPPFAPSISRNSDFLIVSGGYLAGQNWLIIPRVEVYNTTLGLQSAKGDFKVLTLYPNPTNHLLNIAFEAKEHSKITIQIIDAQGSVVNEFEHYNQGNITFKENIDCSHLNSGLYQVTINNNNQIYSQRIVINK